MKTHSNYGLILKNQKKTPRSQPKPPCQQLLSISLPDKGFHIYADAVKYLEVNCDFRYNSLAATPAAKQSVCAFCQRVLL